MYFTVGLKKKMPESKPHLCMGVKIAKIVCQYENVVNNSNNGHNL